MTERVEEPRGRAGTHEPVDPERELARRNVATGLLLFALSLALFAGTWVVAFVYLAVD